MNAAATSTSPGPQLPKQRGFASELLKRESGTDSRINSQGSIEKGKFADIIAVSGNPVEDVAEMERVRFVMKGGLVVRNDLGAR